MTDDERRLFENVVCSLADKIDASKKDIVDLTERIHSKWNEIEYFESELERLIDMYKED